MAQEVLCDCGRKMIVPENCAFKCFCGATLYAVVPNWHLHPAQEAFFKLPSDTKLVAWTGGYGGHSQRRKYQVKGTWFYEEAGMQLFQVAIVKGHGTANAELVWGVENVMASSVDNARVVAVKKAV